MYEGFFFENFHGESFTLTKQRFIILVNRIVQKGENSLNLLMLDKIQSTPAKICLGLTALVMFVYSLNFMFLADCYSIGGDGCFTLLNNKSTPDSDFFGNGAPETAFNGILMFGIFLSSMIILIEGPKGKWTTMIPVMIGLFAMTVAMWMDDTGVLDENTTPKYVVPVVLVLYAVSYFLMKDEGVNEGLSDYKPGIKVQDKFAMVALILLVLMGLFYSLRMIFTPDTVISEGFPSGEEWVAALGLDSSRALGQGVPSEVTVAVSGSLILVYTLWSALVLTNGASGQWSVMHPSLFAFISVTIGTYTGMLAGTARTVSDGNQMDALAGPLVMLLVAIAYFRLRSEGMEDGMTFQGEEVESAWFTNGLLTFALIMGALFAIVSIFWENVG